MKTIKLPYSTTEDLTLILKQYSNIVRYSYNRFLENKTEKDIRLLTKSLSSIDLLNSWLIQCGIKEAKAIFESQKDKDGNKTVIFGGKYNLVKYLKNKISKEEYKLNKLCPVSIQGEKLKKGNRSFKLDIIENNSIFFKQNKDKHFEFKLPKLRNNIKKELYKLQQFNDVKQGESGYTYSVKFDLKNIYISFEEFKDGKNELKSNRYLGIDMNPDTIGISVLDDGIVIYAHEFSLKPIFDKIFSEKLKSNSDRMKYYQNKLKFETFEISKSISLISKQFNCQTVYIEDLEFKTKTGIKKSNRKNKNLWKRNIFINNLTKRLNSLGIKIFTVNPAYSSFIGNMQYDYTDAVNASIEIARRGYEYRIKKNKTEFYPSLLVKHQWKETIAKYANWKEFFIEIKNLKLKYRVSLNECLHKFNVFQQNSNIKSMVLNYVFYS